MQSEAIKPGDGSVGILHARSKADSLNFNRLEHYDIDCAFALSSHRSSSGTSGDSANGFPPSLKPAHINIR